MCTLGEAEEKIVHIADIPEIPDTIKKASSQGRLIVFIGAGVSKIIGCPSWEELALKQLKYLYDSKCITFHEFENLRKLSPRKLLSICKQILDKKRLTPSSSFKDMVKPDGVLLDKYKIYEKLYAWKAVYITTNYDECLDKVVTEIRPQPIEIDAPHALAQKTVEEKKPPKIVFLKEDFLISNIDQGNIIHLHGSILNEDSLILTVIDYLKHYEWKDENPIPIFLEEIFKRYTILFMGYGLEEYEILEYIISKAPRATGALQHYMLYPMFREEVNIFKFQNDYYADLGIKLVPYPIGDNGYEQLCNVVDEWAKIIGPLAKPQGFLEKVKLIDEVI